MKLSHILLFTLASLLFAWVTDANALEREYQTAWCSAKNGKTEVVLVDKTRVDCVTETHAIEFDFAHKWAESIGQALHYAQSTKLRGGIVLIVEPGEEPLVERALRVVQYYRLPIDVWTVPK